MTPGKLPKFIGDYAVLRPLERGLDHLRFAVRREPQSHPRLYVVKLMAPAPEDLPPDLREQYIPRLTRGLSHRNLVDAYQAGEIEGMSYLVMEYALSLDLEFVLAHGRRHGEPLPLFVSLYIGREICRGLAFLHGFGADRLLYGRLCPSHVLLAYSGQVKLAHLHRLTHVGATTTLDTTRESLVAAYQAPELLEGRPVDERADVFAVGAILWECLTGRLMAEGGNGSENRERAMAEGSCLKELLPELGSQVADTVARALRPDPAARFSTAVELGRRLDELLEKHSPGAGGRQTSDWLVGRFRDEFRERRQVQQQLLAEKRAETTSHRVLEVSPGELHPVSGDLIGSTLDQRYRIKRLLGEGGMGQVYETEHIQLGKRLAVKVLHPLYSTEEEVIERFRREARSASAIGHPNIVDVTDSGTTPDGRAYFVMELLDGMELADVITQEGPLEFERAVDIAIQVCQALGAAHKVGIIHRDMKPENVFLTTMGNRTDVVKILDFGIAKSARMERVRGGQLTEPGLAVGTPEYMAPEQAAGKPPDPRFDIYSVGGILYAILTGRPPHRGNNVMEILTRKATKNPTPPRSYRPDIPEQLERLITLSLARNPDRRPSTMEELEYELRKSLRGRPDAVAHMLGISSALSRMISNESDLDDTSEIQRLARDELEGLASRAESPPRPGTGASLQGEHVTLPSSGPDEDELFSKNVTPTELVTWEPMDGDEEDLGKTTPFKPLEPGLESAEPPLDRGRLLRVVASLGSLLTAVALGLWLLWPEGDRPLDVDPGAVARSTPAAEAGDGPASSAPGPVPVVGWEVHTDAGAPDPALQKHWQERRLRGWVDFAWRAARDGRILDPPRDNLLFGMDRISEMDPDHKALAKLRGYAERRLLRRARRQRRRGQAKRAEESVRGTLTIRPESPVAKKLLMELLVARGHKALKADRKDDAKRLAEEAAELAPEAVAPQLLSAKILEAEESLKEALDAYEAILTKHRGHRQARRAARDLKKKLKKRR